MTRLDAFLLVKEINARFLSLKADENDVLAAITPTSRHEDRSYERLEFFGECSLAHLR
jgi:hypothetical protein